MTASDWRVRAVAGVAGVLALLTFAHVPGLNGTWYWQWAWQRLGVWEVVPGMLLAAVPALAAQWWYPRRINAGVGIVLLMVSVLAMQFACARRAGDPVALDRLTRVVGGTVSSSYFRSAGILLADGVPDQAGWLGTYPGRMRGLYLHARNKPPGLVMVHFPLVRRLGFNELAATVGGLYMAALTPLCVPAVYLMLRAVTRDRGAAFYGAALLPFTPALVLMFPTWDQVFPVLAAGMVGFWVKGVDTGRWAYATAFGLVLAGTLFFTFNLLVLGVFLGGYALVALRVVPGWDWRKLAVRAGIAIGVVVAFYVVLHAMTGYDPVATLRAGIANQRELERTLLKRPYPVTIPFDVLDFLLGAGWVTVLLVGFYVRRRVAEEGWGSREVMLAGLVIAQVVILAVTGLLTVETARVWMFLIPVWLVPVGMELAGWGRGGRFVVYLAMLVCLVALTVNMRFVLA